jgi:hypothetical protein
MFGAAAELKSLWVVEGAKHQDFLRYDPKGYEEHVVRFLVENLKREWTREARDGCRESGCFTGG